MKTYLTPVSILLCSLLTLVSCKKEADNELAVSGPTNTEAQTVSLNDGQLELKIPAGAMAEGTQISVKTSTEKFADTGAVLHQFELLPAGTKFNKPVTLTLHYTDDMLKGNSPENIGLAFKNEADGKWYALIGGKIDAASKTISVKITHFSHWAYFSALHLYTKVNGVLSRDNEINLPMLTKERAEVCIVMDLPPLSADDEEMLKILQQIGEILATDPVNPAASEDCPDCALLAPVTFTPPVSTDDIHNKIIKPDKWMVNGVKNGNSATGTITDFVGNIYHYDAPGKMPLDNPMAIAAVINTEKHGQLQLIQQVNVYARKWRYQISRQSAHECEGLDDFGYAYDVNYGGTIDFTIAEGFELASAKYTANPLKVLQAGNCTCVMGIRLEPFSNTGIFFSDLKLTVDKTGYGLFPSQIMLSGNGREYAEFKATWTTDDCGANYAHTETENFLLSEEYYVKDFPLGFIPDSPLKTKLDDDGEATIEAIE